MEHTELNTNPNINKIDKVVIQVVFLEDMLKQKIKNVLKNSKIGMTLKHMKM
ncbi:MAG: hypothetical protein KID00_01000 [Clostridium argentinense]|nr:hypothetical protein [Clostridium argentinense]